MCFFFLIVLLGKIANAVWFNLVLKKQNQKFEILIKVWAEETENTSKMQ